MKKYVDERSDFYSQLLNNCNSISREEEIELVKLMKDGDENAREKLIVSNLRLVVLISNEFKGRGYSVEDLISEGNIGLIKSIEKYNTTDFNTRLGSYATFWIKREMRNAIAIKSGLIKVPKKTNDMSLKVFAVKKRLSEELKKEASVEEIAKETGYAVFVVKRILKTDSKNALVECLSDDLVCENDLPNEILYRKEDINILTECIKKMSHDDRMILLSMYGVEDKKTMQQLGDELGYKKSQIKNMSIRAIEKLKQSFKQWQKLN